MPLAFPDGSGCGSLSAEVQQPLVQTDCYLSTYANRSYRSYRSYETYETYPDGWAREARPSPCYTARPYVPNDDHRTDANGGHLLVALSLIVRLKLPHQMITETGLRPCLLFFRTRFFR